MHKLSRPKDNYYL